VEELALHAIEQQNEITVQQKEQATQMQLQRNKTKSLEQRIAEIESLLKKKRVTALRISD
jgi:hypothetical protein